MKSPYLFPFTNYQNISSSFQYFSLNVLKIPSFRHCNHIPGVHSDCSSKLQVVGISRDDHLHVTTLSFSCLMWHHSLHDERTHPIVIQGSSWGGFLSSTSRFIIWSFFGDYRLENQILTTSSKSLLIMKNNTTVPALCLSPSSVWDICDVITTNNLERGVSG